MAPPVSTHLRLPAQNVRQHRFVSFWGDVAANWSGYFLLFVATKSVANPGYGRGLLLGKVAIGLVDWSLK